jgi:hypothetical protein
VYFEKCTMMHMQNALRVEKGFWMRIITSENWEISDDAKDAKLDLLPTLERNCGRQAVAIYFRHRGVNRNGDRCLIHFLLCIFII